MLGPTLPHSAPSARREPRYIDPQKSFNDLAFQPGDTFPLALLFNFPGFAVKKTQADFLGDLGGNLPSEFFDNTSRFPAEPLLTALSNINPNDVPLELYRGNILSGIDQYMHMSRNYEPYRLGRAEEKIIEREFGFFSECIGGNNLLDICAGHAWKTKKIVDKLQDNRNLPENIFVHDVVPDNLWVTKRLLTKGSYPAHKVHLVQGDINALKAIWEDPQPRLIKPSHLSGYKDDILKWLRNNNKQTVGLYQGATFNNFTFDQMSQQLKFFHDSFKEGSLFIIGIDSTTDRDALRAQYDNNRFKQLAITAVAYAYWAGAVDDPKKLAKRIAGLTCKVKIARRGGYVQTIVRDTVRKQNLPFEPICKIRERELKTLLKNAELEIVRRMPYTEGGLNHAFVAVTQKGARRRALTC